MNILNHNLTNFSKRENMGNVEYKLSRQIYKREKQKDEPGLKVSFSLYRRGRKLQVKFSNKGTILIASIIGELDHHTAEYIRSKIDTELIKSTTRDVIFDFTKVVFMDSSGIGVLMGRYKNIQKMKGRAVIVNPSPQIKKIFEISGVFKFLPLYQNMDKAIDDLMN